MSVINLNKNIQYPLPPQKDDADMMEVYARFMRHLRHVPIARDEIKVLASIQFTADMMGLNDAQVSKMLVDLGLRVSRAGLPAYYLHHVDEALSRSGWVVGGPNAAVLELKAYWDGQSCTAQEKAKPRYSVDGKEQHMY